jgi:hypothetical protein
MNVIICLDDSNGMMFNKRRQSRDRNVLNDILDNCTSTLYIESYSSKLFFGIDRKLNVTDLLLDTAGNDDTCFIETKHLYTYEAKIATLVIYKWNRKYPGDFFLDINLQNHFVLMSSSDFEGRSHEKITKEIWKHV